MSQAEGDGIYFDGVTGARQPVTLRLEDTAIAILAQDGTERARWDFTAIEQLPATADRLWLARGGSASTARLAVPDPAFAAAVREHVGFGTPQHQASERRRRRVVVVWSAAAVAAVLTIGVVGLPAIAESLAPLVPYAREARIGAAVNNYTLSTQKAKGPVECGEQGEKEKAGKAAFEKLFRQLEAAAELPIPMRAYIIRTDVINAGALPGGYLHVNLGIIRFAESPEELAFIVGHELGHVAHRHGLRRILHGLGLVYFMAMVTGDVFTAGGVILAAHTVLDRRHSRAQERQADAYGIRLLSKLGVETHAGAEFWDRLSRLPEKSKESQQPKPEPKKGGRPKALLSFTHPHSAERSATIRATPRPPHPKPLLTAGEWQALRQVCAGT